MTDGALSIAAGLGPADFGHHGVRQPVVKHPAEENGGRA